MSHVLLSTAGVLGTAGDSSQMRAFREEGAERDVASYSAASLQPCPELPPGFLAGLFARRGTRHRQDGHGPGTASKAAASRLVDGLLTSVASRVRPRGPIAPHASALREREETAQVHDEVTLRSPPGKEEETLHSPPALAAEGANPSSSSSVDGQANLALREIGDEFATVDRESASQGRTKGAAPPEQSLGAQSPRATLRREGGGSTGALPTMEAVTPIEPSATSPDTSELSPPWPSSVSPGTAGDALSRDAGQKNPSHLSSSSSGLDTTQEILRGAILEPKDAARPEGTVEEGTFACSSTSDLSNVVRDAEAALQRPTVDSSVAETVGRGSVSDKDGDKAEASRLVAMPRPSESQADKINKIQDEVEPPAHENAGASAAPLAAEHATATAAAAQGARSPPDERSTPQPKATSSKRSAVRLVDNLLSSFSARSSSPDRARSTSADNSPIQNVGSGGHNRVRNAADVRAGHGARDGSADASAGPDGTAGPAIDGEQQVRTSTVMEERQQEEALRGGGRESVGHVDQKTRARPVLDDKSIQAQRRLAAEGLTACLQRASQVPSLRFGFEALWRWLEAERSREAVVELQDSLDRKKAERRRADAECQVDVIAKDNPDGAAGDAARSKPDASVARLDSLENRIEALMQMEKHRDEVATQAAEAVVRQQAELLQQNTLNAEALQETTRRLEALSTQLESATTSPVAHQPPARSAQPQRPADLPISHGPPAPSIGQGHSHAAQPPTAFGAGGRARPSSAVATVGRTLPSLLGGGPDSAGGVGVSPEELRREWEALTMNKAVASTAATQQLQSVPPEGDRGEDILGRGSVLPDGVRKEHLAACGVFRARLSPLLDPTPAAQQALVLERLKTSVGEHYAVLCMQSKVRCFQARRILGLLQRRRPRSRHRSRSHSRGIVAASQVAAGHGPTGELADLAALTQGDLETMQNNRPRSASFENALARSRPRSAESVASSMSAGYYRRRFYAIEEQGNNRMMMEVRADGEHFADTPGSSNSSHPLAMMDGGLSGIPSELLQYTQLPRSRPSSSGLSRSRPSSSGRHRVRSAARSRPSASSDGSRPSVVPPLRLDQIEANKFDEMFDTLEKANNSEVTILQPEQHMVSRVQLPQTPMLETTLQWRPAPEDLDQFVAERLQERPTTAIRADLGQEAVLQHGASPQGRAHRTGKSQSAPAHRRGSAKAAASQRHGQRSHPGRGRAQSQPSGSGQSSSPVTLPGAMPGERRANPNWLSTGPRQRPRPLQSPANLKGASPKAQRSVSAGALHAPNSGVPGAAVFPTAGSASGNMRPVTAQQKSPPGRSSSSTKRMPSWSAIGGSRTAPELHRAEQLLAATRAATAYDWPPMSGAAFGLRPKSAPNGMGGGAFAIARGSYADSSGSPQNALPPPVVDPVERQRASPGVDLVERLSIAHMTDKRGADPAERLSLTYGTSQRLGSLSTLSSVEPADSRH